jgi:hypothetical protein
MAGPFPAIHVSLDQNGSLQKIKTWMHRNSAFAELRTIARPNCKTQAGNIRLGQYQARTRAWRFCLAMTTV